MTVFSHGYYTKSDDASFIIVKGAETIEFLQSNRHRYVQCNTAKSWTLFYENRMFLFYGADIAAWQIDGYASILFCG